MRFSNPYAIAFLTLLSAATANATSLVGRNTVGAFHTNDDNDEHAILGLSGGRVEEVYWQDSVSGWSAYQLYAYPSAVVAVDGWWSPNDNNRHAVVALADQTIHEIYYGGSCSGICEDRLSAPLGYTVKDVSGWYDSGEGCSHVAAALASGYVIEYNFCRGIWTYHTSSFPSITDVDGYASGYYGGAYHEQIVAYGSSYSYAEDITETETYPVSLNTGYIYTSYGNCAFSSPSGVTAYRGTSSSVLAWANSNGDECAGLNSDPTTSYLQTSYVTWSFGRGVMGLSGYLNSNTPNPVYHQVTAMANGDLYDMYSTSYGIGYNYHYLGTW